MKIILDKAKQNILSNPLTENINSYDKDKTYSKNAVVEFEGYIYRSVADNNDSNPNNRLKWYFWDSVENRDFPVPFASNPYRIFDDYSSTYSTITTSLINFKFKTDLSTFVRIENTDAEVVEIIIKNEDNEIIYNAEEEMLENPIWDFVDYFYWQDVNRKKSISFTIPRIFNGTIEIILKNASKIGSIVIGEDKKVGCTKIGATYNYNGEQKAILDKTTGIKFFQKSFKGGISTVTVDVGTKNSADVKNAKELLLLQDIVYLVIGEGDDLFTVRGKITNFSTTLEYVQEYKISIDII